MSRDNKHTISKSLLLNWLNSADQEFLVDELGKWIEAKTNGCYVLLRQPLSEK